MEEDPYNTEPTPDKPLRVAGYGGVALNAPSWRETPFSNAVEGWSAATLTLRERSMIQFMDEITDKPEWSRKIHDEKITKKWRAELKGREQDAEDQSVFSDTMFNYCLGELKDYAGQLENAGFVPAIDASAVVCKSDTLIDEELKKALCAAAAPLENVPENHKDWHPGSDQQVLDLVHPSLFPLLYGRSRILGDQLVPLRDCATLTGRGETMPVPGPNELQSNARNDHGSKFPDVVYSKRFQWLPCEVAFRDDDRVEITSYINNLHPDTHEPLYKVIEKILAKAMPMLARSITSCESDPRDTRISFSGVDYTNAELADESEVSEEDWDDNANEDYWDYVERWRNEHRTLVFPDPPEEYTPRRAEGDGDDVDLRDEFPQGLQVIVKLANIHLTPENPSYAGGSWHVEGSLNEHICATMLYYYDCENITESRLAFREQISPYDLEDTSYEQGDFAHFTALFGIEDQGDCLQPLGSVLTREGRLITFPNVLQHCVQPFQLADASKPGHRKILALFVVDPHVRIPSSANVPPQQREWWGTEALKVEKLAKLPREVADYVVNAVDEFPIGMKEAKELRLQLMEERSVFHDKVDTALQYATFGFCEH